MILLARERSKGSPQEIMLELATGFARPSSKVRSIVGTVITRGDCSKGRARINCKMGKGEPDLGEQRQESSLFKNANRNGRTITNEGECIEHIDLYLKEGKSSVEQLT